MIKKINANVYLESFVDNYFDDMLCDDKKKILYSGDIDNVPVELSSRICDFMFWDEKDNKERRRFYNYGTRSVVSYPFLSSTESIKSACNEKYCVIFRKNIL